ncbi:transcription factor A, mitochondrial-like [Oscarella lobularis]|uniref:transcription factor A, mitochondrial-like n=1 Tax=Oscarella lobularis TaxID=121494 RepID=UPI0033140BEB
MLRIARSFLQPSIASALFPRCLASASGDAIAELVKRRPRRPKNSYMLFAEDVRGQLKDEFPHLKPGELTLLLSDQYRALSEARKQDYKVRADELLAEFRLAKDRFMRDLDEAQKQELVEFERRQKEKKKSRVVMGGQKVDDGRPKRPLSAYALFISDYFGSEDMKSLKDLKTPMTDRMIKAGEKWKTLSDEEKEDYRMKANESRTKYEEELRIWKEHQPVLPKKALSPYNIFVKELFMSGALDGENMKVKDKMAAAATRWKELTDDEKTDYKRKAADDKERYEKDVSEYEAKYGPLKTGKEMVPKKPLGPFAVFTQEVAETGQFADKEAKEVLHEMAEMWRAMTETEKQVYAEKADADKVRYEQEYREWQALKAMREKAAKRRRKTPLV